MAKKNRRRPFRCPVSGCGKRGMRQDLMRHARAVHPGIQLHAYGWAIDQGQTIFGAKPPLRSAYRFENGPWKPLRLWPWLSSCLSVITVIGLVAWIAFFR